MFYSVQLFIPVLLLRTLIFTEIRTCETTDKLSWVISFNIRKYFYQILPTSPEGDDDLLKATSPSFYTGAQQLQGACLLFA